MSYLKRRLWLAVIMAALVVVTATGLSALAGAKMRLASIETHPRLERAQSHYIKIYVKARKKVGSDVGRNLVVDGYNGRRGARTASRQELNESMDTLQSMIHPPPAPELTTTATTSETYEGGSYSIPSYIVECESGGSYSAENPSGAYGAYQIMPETAAAYGCDLSTASGQDQCAAEIYADVGASAWSCG